MTPRALEYLKYMNPYRREVEESSGPGRAPTGRRRKMKTDQDPGTEQNRQSHARGPIKGPFQNHFHKHSLSSLFSLFSGSLIWWPRRILKLIVSEMILFTGLSVLPCNSTFVILNFSYEFLLSLQLFWRLFCNFSLLTNNIKINIFEHTSSTLSTPDK